MGLGAGLQGRGRHHEIDLDSLPAMATRTGSKVSSTFVVLFALVWGGFPMLALAQQGLPSLEKPETFLFLLFPTIGFGLLLFGLHQFLWRKTVTIDRHFVTVDQRGLFGSGKWQEPLSRYQGVLSRTRVVRTKNSSYTLYLVDLAHPDKRKTVNLYTATRDRGWRARWEDCARKLGLPALEQGDGGLIARDAADLDKPIGDLIDEGKVEIDQNVLHKKPEGLALDYDGDITVFTRTGPQNSLLGSLLAVTFPLVFVYFGFFHEGIPRFFGWVFGSLGVLFQVAFLLGVGWDWLSRQRLRIGPQALSINALGPWGETKGKALPVDAIEGVKIGRDGRSHGKALIVTGDHDTLKFGVRLPRESLEILRYSILAKIARHHRRRRRFAR